SILWYSPWGMGLYRYDLNHMALKRFRFASRGTFDINERNIITSILPHRQYLLCGTGDGLIIFNTVDETYVVLTHHKNNPFSIPDDDIRAMFIDRDSTLWLATGIGLCKSDLNKKLFGFFSEEIKEKPDGPPIEIKHFAVYQSEWLIIGTENEGVYAYNMKTHERKHYVIKNAKNPRANFFGKVFIDRENNIWVTSYYGLRIYNLNKNRMEMPPSDFAGLNIGICLAFYQDSHKDYWMSYEAEPKFVHCIYVVNSRYRLEKFNHDNGGFPLMKINRIQEDTQGNVWISTNWSLGFLRWSRSDNSFTRLPRVKSPEEYLSESVNDLLPDHGNSVWIASGSGHGLISYNWKTNRQQNFTTEDGMISNYLVSLFKRHHNLWISTDNGISQFDSRTGKFTSYSQEDGLPETSFIRKFVYDSASNLLYACTAHCIIYFNPDTIVHADLADKRSRIYLKKFQVNGNDIHHDFTGILQLDYSENNVNIEFSCINFSEGGKLKFEYQLEGLERNWNPSGKRRFVNYTNLYPGTYRFNVRTNNTDGSYSSPVTIALFIIDAPFYFTWWFVLILTMAAASVVYIMYDYRKRNHRAMVAVRERISRDLHDDIGSTLNSISIYSEMAKMKNTGADQREKFMEIIGSSSRNMIDQINDIVWTVNPMNDKFESVLMRMRSFTSELGEGKNMQLKFEVDENCRMISLGMNERKNFYLIFKEALNNAIKYADATEVKIRVSLAENFLSLRIVDNGVGFDTSKQVEVLPRMGGNGLRNMNLRAGEIKGEFRINSTIGKGTTVELKLKIKFNTIS
ncbi:MAG: two-component regulator propeller domain-containing protein, partial [Bacteroidota bacterium]